MITGKVIDKATKAPMPNVHIILADAGGEYIKNSEGIIATQSDKEGKYEIEMAPGQYIQFSTFAYPVVTRSYEDAIRKPNVELDDASGTALSMPEVKAFMADAGKRVQGQWLIGVGILIFVAIVLVVIGKKNGWF